MTSRIEWTNSVNELKEIARLMNIPNYDEFQQELIYKISINRHWTQASSSIKDSLFEVICAKAEKVEVKETR